MLLPPRAELAVGGASLPPAGELAFICLLWTKVNFLFRKDFCFASVIKNTLSATRAP